MSRHASRRKTRGRDSPAPTHVDGMKRVRHTVERGFVLLGLRSDVEKTVTRIALGVTLKRRHGIAHVARTRPTAAHTQPQGKDNKQ